MSKDIWHKKTEQPKKLLHCTRLIITKWGSVYSEKDIDNGAFIETDWVYLDDLLGLETDFERTQKALDVAKERLKNTILDAEILATSEYLASRAKETLDEITALEQKEE